MRRIKLFTCYFSLPKTGIQAHCSREIDNLLLKKNSSGLTDNWVLMKVKSQPYHFLAAYHSLESSEPSPFRSQFPLGRSPLNAYRNQILQVVIHSLYWLDFCGNYSKQKFTDKWTLVCHWTLTCIQLFWNHVLNIYIQIMTYRPTLLSYCEV